jgi:adenosylcobinamide-GDP ribazoletransferase
LADLADGLGSRAQPERALEIMRRSDIGPFGVLTVALTLAMQVLALALLPAGGSALAGWVAALTLGRLALVLACGPWTRAARPDGLGAMVVGSVTWSRLAVAAASTGAILLIAATVGPLDSLRTLLVAPLCAAAVAALVTLIAARRLRGSTGDTLGATVELATTAALLALVL